MALTNRTLLIFKYLWETTDESHPVSLADISAFLKQHGITADPRTLRNDIEQLVEFGVDIVKDRRVQNLYHVEKQGAGQTADALCRSRRRRADGTASLHRQPRKSHQRGRLHQRRLVPCCTITTQQDQIIRVLLGQFLEKYVHTSRIAIRHNKKTGASRYWFNCSVCIPIFTNVMARYRWTNALFTPAVFGLIDSSESCFILEHKSYFLMWMTRLVYIIL